MFLKFALKSSSTLALATCAIFSSSTSVVAQTTVSFGQIRNPPTTDSETRTEPSKATRLFSINEEKSLPPVSETNSARIVDAKIINRSKLSRATPAAQIAPPATPATMPLSSFDAVALPMAKATPLPLPTPVNRADGRGYYTVAFAQSTDSTRIQELDAPELGQLETEDTALEEAEKDADEKELDKLDLSVDDDESLDDDDEESLVDDIDEDTPIARPQFGNWPSKSIQEVRVDASEYDAKVPEDRSGTLFESSRRFGGDIAASKKVFAWAAPNMGYQPLYFEDVALERYGQTKGLIKQPFVSAGKFLADGLFLGTRARRVHPNSCDSPLGFCRPGSPSTANGACGCSQKNNSPGTCQSCR